MSLEADRSLRRFERDAVLACAGMAILGFAASGGRWDVGGGVLAGGLLMAASYWAVKGAADALIGSRPGRPGAPDPGAGPASGADGEVEDGAAAARPLTLRRRVLAAVKFFTRYALLAVGAYVMLTCFRLHPAAVLAGAVSPFAAAIVQLVRMARSSARREHPL